jgi:hypothetical protein
MGSAKVSPIEGQTPGCWPSPRFGVFFRRDGREPWRLLVHAGCQEAATRAMFALVASDLSGDWLVSDVPPGGRTSPSSG